METKMSYLIEYLTHCNNGHCTDTSGISTLPKFIGVPRMSILLPSPSQNILIHKNYSYFVLLQQVQTRIHNFLLMLHQIP